MATLSFHGAARQVTGSCYRIETGNETVLLECGLFQGPPEVEYLNKRRFPFEHTGLDAVLLSHAHLDHAGLLPRLGRDGYRGPVYVTPPTRDLLDIMLKDAAYLQERDAERDRRRGRTTKADEMLYTAIDVEQTLTQCRTVAYGKRFRVTDNIEARFGDAGHILGSAIVEIWIRTGNKTVKLVHSGDLGYHETPLLPTPQAVRAADILLLESTYGDRDHRPMSATLAEFREILDTAADTGGNVLIPAFAIGRAQELLYRLSELYHAGQLKQRHIFLDSPMAIAATELHARHRDVLNPGALEFLDRVAQLPGGFLPPLRYTRDAQASAAIGRITDGTIIIAGSGMCTGGRIQHHLRNNLERAETHVIFVGFQAEGTPGRALVDGADSINLWGDSIPVKAQIHTLGGFSAHAGQNELAAWVGEFTQTRPRVYLIHGEPDKMDALAERLRRDGITRVECPALETTITL